MNVVDSSAWLEYFADGPNADPFAEAIENTEALLVPAVTLYEVFKRICQQRTRAEALQAVTVMQQGTVADVDTTLALQAAQLSMETGLPMADSLILATARAHRATVWTQDGHFEGMEGVEYRPCPAKAAPPPTPPRTKAQPGRPRAHARKNT